ncbi:hypothetical protein QYE76_018333 [Lolium multiflorum]|uniref:Gag-pol polyprotein n=1 Tax=Lolium multiflorum TaxID=4521 RepID=A0AAD8V8P2_LOLMU|nr:hypothetical protein QYE76_018333 [Lolium multiflorum]
MVGRGRPPPPPQVARDEGIRPRRRNMEDEENMYGKLKFNMPKFKGEDDAEAYLSWALKVDKIFRIHNYSGAKKVAMASLEFEDYANTWWEQVVTLREEKGDPPIDTWEDMKEEMQARFVPTHYKTDLFNKLQKLKQGTKTVEEFFKEMELTMMRANIQESENQTIARFFNGLNYPIKKIVEFQPYSNMVELVHQASKAERQVNEDIKYSKSKQYFASKLATSTPTTSVKPSASSTPSKQPSIQSRMKQTVSSTASSKASTGPSNVTCFKCGTQGHKSFECKNTKVMITMENGDIETLSEGEYEALVQAAVANEEDYDEESGEDPLLCTHDPSPSLVVTRVLTTQPQAMEDQRCNIFQTRAGIGGKSIKVIIDGGSCHNLASTELCEKLNLTLRKHPHPYHVQWLSDKGNVKIQHTVTVNFKIGPYEDTVECDVVPMTVCHMLLGRPWQFDKKAIHDGFSNAYTFKVKDKKFELRPMTPSQIIADNAKALARAQHHIHHSELRGEGATHQKESERHHPHMSERKSVLLTTKSEWREVKDNPSTTIHYVLICKGLSAETNDLTNIPSSLLSLLKEFQDVFPDELPHGLPPLRGIEHRIDLIPGAPLPNRAAYRTNPEDTKEIQRQIQDLLAKGEVVRLHGIPASIVSDRDVKFMSYLWKSLMAKFGVKLLFSSSSHPQTDGQTEVVNRSLSTLLRTLVKTNLKSWEDCLPHAEFAYNRAKHSTTARSPFMVVYGFEPPTALDILPLPLHERTNMDFDERTTAIKKLHEETRATIQEHVLRQATRLNAKKKERVFEEGDLVWIHLRKERFPQERNSKLKPRGDGPFKVLKRINNNAYVIDIPTSKYLVSNTFNVSDLSPYHGDEEEQESRTTLSQGGGDDAGWPSVTSSPRPTSPPSGPMTRARAKAIHDKVNSLLTTLDLDTPLDGMLPHAETLCVIRYMEHQGPGKDETSWSREGEEQQNLEMNMEPKPTSPEERQGRKGRWPVQDPVRPAPRPDAPVRDPVNRTQTGPAPSYRTTTGPRTGFFAESRLATGRPDPGPDSPVTGPIGPHTGFEEGDLVWVHLRKERFPQERNSKLKPRGDGPFKVLKRINNNAYVIDIPTSKYLVSNTFNISDLSPHHGDEEEQESRTTLSQGGGDDVAPLTNDTTSRPTSPPSGPMTRARVKALHEKVNSLLSTSTFDTPLDGLLLHANTLCSIRYIGQDTSHGVQANGERAGNDEDGAPAHRPELPPPGPELPPSRTGTSALQDRNFRLDAAKMPSSAQRSGASRNFRPEGPELPPTRNFRAAAAPQPRLPAATISSAPSRTAPLPAARPPSFRSPLAACAQQPQPTTRCCRAPLAQTCTLLARRLARTTLAQRPLLPWPKQRRRPTPTPRCSDIDDAIAMEMRDSTICEMSDSTICEMSDSTICELDECLHFESMSDAPSSMDDETPIMEKMYMVHEDDDITPCLLLEDEHGGHIEPTTSTTPTSYERDYKGYMTFKGHSSVGVIYLLYTFMKIYRRGRLFFKWGEMIRGDLRSSPHHVLHRQDGTQR